jgi:hypothetical protein
MTQEGNLSESTVSPLASGAIHQSSQTPGWGWVVRWVLLTTAAIPAAFILSAPFAAVALWIQKLGAQAGLWTGENRPILTMAGFIASLALTLAVAQWYMLRSRLPRAKGWFIATVAGVLLGGLIAWIGLTAIPALAWEPVWGWAVLVLLAGAGLGLAQWFYLRRIVPHAFWIIIINALAVGSGVFSGNIITSFTELLVLLLLPGMITGAGLWLLLAPFQATAVRPVRVQSTETKSRRIPRIARIGLALAALVPVFFACSWVYAASQLVLAKNEGIYASPEEAIIARNSQGWGGASVVKLEDIWANPNNHDGALPHVWFGGATVYLDRIPEGGNLSQYNSGSFYLHVRNGWVHLPEGAFPEFVGWVMELYDMEGVSEWIGGS